MLIDSVVINLIHTGAGLGPVYNISIYGYGKVIYEGFENVNVKGKKESIIDEKSVVLILNELKSSNFFSFKDNYSRDNSENRPCTVISVSIPKNENDFIKKSVKYCQGNKEVPIELKNLVKKIEEIINSERWVGKYENFIQKKDESLEIKEISIKEKVSSTKVKKNPYKLIGVVLVVLVIISIVAFSVFSGILNFSSNKKNDQNNVILGSNLEITLVEPAKNVDFDTGNYTYTINFKAGDIIYIIQEYTNISTTATNECDLVLSIIVSNNDTLFHTNKVNRTYIGKSIQVWYFESALENNIWPVGEYLVTVTLEDNISNTIAKSKTTKFYIS